MQFVYETGGQAWELDLRVEHPDACVADLAAALRPPVEHAGERSDAAHGRPAEPGGELWIDGRRTPGDLGLGEAGLVAGAVVRPGADPDAAFGIGVGAGTGTAGAGASSPRGAYGVTPPLPAVAVVRVVGGLDAGASIPVGPGSVVVGRLGDGGIRLADPGVSREHCRLDVGAGGAVTISDLRSTNGTEVDGEPVLPGAPVPVAPDQVVTLGDSVQLRVLPFMLTGPVVALDPLREAGAAGTLPFNRAPRTALPADPQPLGAPQQPNKRAGGTFSVASILGPLVMAGAMVALLHDLRFAAFALLSPVMVLGNWFETRTKGRRSLRRDLRDFSRDLDELRASLGERRQAEIRRRRALLPDPAEISFRATAPSPWLWERRASSGDFLVLSAGLADLPWQPPVRDDRGTPPPEVAELLAELGELPWVPVPVSLAPGGVVGLEGDRYAALAVARALLCQAVTTSGPADVTVAVFCDQDRAADWDWAKWLPHVLDQRSGGSSRLLAVGDEAVDALAKELLDAGRAQGQAQDGPGGNKQHSGPVLLLVVDGATLTEGRPCPLRELLAGRGGPAGGIVLTNRLPALCTVTMMVAPEGHAELRRPATAELVPDLLAAGVDEPTARTLARALARFEDPELGIEGAGLPDQVPLLPLLELPELTPQALAARWRVGTSTLRAGAALGVTEHGVFRIDLDDDGPHGLIAGTTGSGKSELLRTLVASLATGNDPEHLTFALIDYKGGGALDECARLPHVVGLVTDLDEQLGERALRCLEAELRHRELLFREARVSHIRDYQRERDGGNLDLEPMPRLVVVIDEFATLVKALPDFVDSLVGIAQRGRSLGVHLIMATQRPAGSVSEAIKNNVKLRIALRLESSGDSQDVIDSPAAAAIGGRQWGRGFHRVSAREVEPVQTALSTTVSGARGGHGPVSVAPFRFERTQRQLVVAAAAEAEADQGPTDLVRLVDAARGAAEAAGIPAPRQPWPPPLPAVVADGDLPAEAACGLQTDVRGLAAVALADDPDRQAAYPVGWDPAAGNLLIYGVVGSGTSTALASIGLALARRNPPDRLHLYVLDLGAGELAPLGELPHAGAYVAAAERERQIRLVRRLRDELNRRKAAAAPADSFPAVVVLIDGIGSFLGDFSKDALGLAVVDDLGRVYADGPAVGITFAVAADRAGAVPGAWTPLTQQKVLLRLADANDYSNFGVRRGAVPTFVPGRAVVAASSQIIQFAWPGEDLAAAVEAAAGRWPDAKRSAPGVGLLPAQLTLASLGVRGRTGADPWWLPVGLGDRALEPVGLQLYEHEHALIAGPARSGRSTALCALAEALAATDKPPAVVAFAPRRSPLRDAPGISGVTTTSGELRKFLADLDLQADGRPLALLIDDADTVDDKDGVVAGLLASTRPDLHLIAAGRADALRRAYGHWTQKVRESRCCLLLVPDVDMDGELAGVTLPRIERLAPLPGRGYLAANGALEGIQVGLPAGMP